MTCTVPRAHGLADVRGNGHTFAARSLPCPAPQLLELAGKGVENVSQRPALAGHVLHRNLPPLRLLRQRAAWGEEPGGGGCRRRGTAHGGRGRAGRWLSTAGGVGGGAAAAVAQAHQQSRSLFGHRQLQLQSSCGQGQGQAQPTTGELAARLRHRPGCSRNHPQRRTASARARSATPPPHPQPPTPQPMHAAHTCAGGVQHPTPLERLRWGNACMQGGAGRSRLVRA